MTRDSPLSALVLRCIDIVIAMCGRYVTPKKSSIERAWDLRGASSASSMRQFMEKTFNNADASPLQAVPLLRVIRGSDGTKELAEARWGLIPHWANGEPPKDKQTGLPLTTFNATIENLRTSPTYRDAWTKGQRCLVPVRGFYEWQAQPPDWQRTVRYFITVDDQELFCFGGLWDKSIDPNGTSVESVTVITMPANELMRSIHNSRKRGSERELLPESKRRMAAILTKEDQETWLTGTADQAWKVLKPYPSEHMVARPLKGPVDPRKSGRGGHV